MMKLKSWIPNRKLAVGALAGVGSFFVIKGLTLFGVHLTQTGVLVGIGAVTALSVYLVPDNRQRKVEEVIQYLKSISSKEV